MSDAIRRYKCLPRDPVTKGRFALRSVCESDIETIRRWRNAQMQVLRQSEPIAVDQQQAYYAQHIWPAMEEAQPANILLTLLRDGQPIGYGGLVHIAWEHSRAEISFLADPEIAQDTCLYKEAFSAFLVLAKQLAFRDLAFGRLFAETYAIRSAHLAILEAHGFVAEGRMRQHVRLAGAPVDSLLHGCLAIEAQTACCDEDLSGFQERE